MPSEPATAPRWPVGSSCWFTEEFLSDAAGMDKREGEFDFAGATWQHRETITDEQGRRTYRCERVDDRTGLVAAQPVLEARDTRVTHDAESYPRVTTED